MKTIDFMENYLIELEDFIVSDDEDKEFVEMMNTIYQDLKLLEKYKTFIDILKSNINMELFHIKHSKYYTLYLCGIRIELTKEQYRLLETMKGVFKK